VFNSPGMRVFSLLFLPFTDVMMAFILTPYYGQRKVVLNEEEFQLTDNHVFKPSNRSKPLKLDYNFNTLLI